MQSVLYRLTQVEKHYPSRASAAVSLDEPLCIQRGEVFALVGPSGAGKSTLLRLLGLIEPPSRGVIEFHGTVLNSHNAAPLELRRRVVLVFQRPILLNASVRDNVMYGLKVRGQKDVEEKVERALAEVGLLELKHAHARTLSGGEAQRAALARALVIEPDVLLLDEPTANLDPYNVSLIEQIIRTQHERASTTVVMVTHNIFQARRLAERVGLLIGGKMVEVNSCEAFFESPRDARTRAFVRGEMIY